MSSKKTERPVIDGHGYGYGYGDGYGGGEI